MQGGLGEDSAGPNEARFGSMLKTGKEATVFVTALN
jgi:hypothetical protein